MQLSKMVQETLTTEEIEVIEEKKKCNKKKATPMMEDGMSYCAKCGTEYDSALDACPSCESTETTTQCGAMELNMAKLEASINGGSAEDVPATEAKLKALKASYETTCEEEEKSETPAEEKKEEMMGEEVDCKAKKEALDKMKKEVEAGMSDQPDTRQLDAEEMLRKATETYNSDCGKMTESLITETEISAEEKEIAWLKSLMSN